MCAIASASLCKPLWEKQVVPTDPLYMVKISQHFPQNIQWSSKANMEPGPLGGIHVAIESYTIALATNHLKAVSGQ